MHSAIDDERSAQAGYICFEFSRVSGGRGVHLRNSLPPVHMTEPGKFRNIHDLNFFIDLVPSVASSCANAVQYIQHNTILAVGRFVVWT